VSGARPTTLDLAATPLATGGVQVTWDPPAGPVTLVRAYHPDGLEPGAGDVHPVLHRTLPAGRAGTFTDLAVADGTSYVYQAVAGPARSTPVVVAVPPRALPPLRKPAFRVDKAAYVLAVVDGGRVVKRYPFSMGRAPKRRKLHFDNASTPEGVYRIVGVQPRATYYKAFDLDYPNALDRARWAARPGLPPIGGEIQIHGGGGTRENWTYGCMALRDADIDELFASGAVGVGTEVRIFGGELTEAEVDRLAPGRVPSRDGT
jgi:hypothetical protein